MKYLNILFTVLYIFEKSIYYILFQELSISNDCKKTEIHWSNQRCILSGQMKRELSGVKLFSRVNYKVLGDNLAKNKFQEFSRDHTNPTTGPILVIRQMRTTSTR